MVSGLQSRKMWWSKDGRDEGARAQTQYPRSPLQDTQEAPETITLAVRLHHHSDLGHLAISVLLCPHL